MGDQSFQPPSWLAVDEYIVARYTVARRNIREAWLMDRSGRRTREVLTRHWEIGEVALFVGVVGAVAYVAADLVRRAAFATHYGDAQYVAANRLLGIAAIVVMVGMVGAVRRLSGRIGIVPRASGWIAGLGFAIMAGGTLWEFVLFIERDDLSPAGWLWFLIGLLVAAVGLTGLGVGLRDRRTLAARMVAGWLIASVPLLVAGYLVGFLGATLAVGEGALCVLAFRDTGWTCR